MRGVSFCFGTKEDQVWWSLRLVASLFRACLGWRRTTSSGRFSGVYGLFERLYKDLFWEELSSIGGLGDGPWCLGGDFNGILSPNERSRGGRLSSAMRRFSEVLNEMGLRDLLL